MHRSLGVLALLVVFGVVASACSVDGDTPADLAFADQSGDDGVAAGDEVVDTVDPLRVAVVGVSNVDPVDASIVSPSQLIVADLLFDGLTSWDPVGETVEPAIAESWTVSDNGLVWEFVLADGAAFSSGEAITAADVKRSLERVVSADPTSVPAARLDVVLGFAELASGAAEELSGLVTVDDHTLQVLLSTPFSPLPELLTSPVYGIVPDGGVIGASTSGPYEVVSSDEGGWHLAARAGAAVPATVETVEIVRFDSREAAATAFEKGELDVAPAPADAPDAGVVTVPLHVMVALGMNTAAAPFDDLAFRRAIAAAIDREAIVEELWGDAAVAVDRLVPGPEGCDDAACGFDRAFALEELMRSNPFAEVPEVLLDVAVDESGREGRLAAAVAEDLAAAGIPVTVREHSVAEFVDVAADGELGLFRSGWVAMFPSPDSYLAAFLSDGSDNLTSYGDAAVDELLDVARSAADPDERDEAYHKVEQALLEAVPVIPIAQLQIRMLVSERAQGVQFRSDGTLVLDGVRPG
ncbi:MAG: ABC transporter substrate-binding protein [Acidimicrobiales bacterium]|nr:ABC transporter substrate-binding protein [Acidimicrobiales bacterium]